MRKIKRQNNNCSNGQFIVRRENLRFDFDSERKKNRYNILNIIDYSRFSTRFVGNFR